MKLKCISSDRDRDQYETMALHTQKGIVFLEKYSHFIRDRCAVEMEYAAKLRKLVDNYQPKKKDEEDHQYSPCRAFRHVMTEIIGLAAQHEVIAENLRLNVIREISVLVKDFKEERKRRLQEGVRIMSDLNAQIVSLHRARSNYEKAFQKAEKALDKFQRANAGVSLSQAAVEKQRMNMSIKSQQFEETRNEYVYQLQKTNDLQKQHYHTLMPGVLHQLQELDENRIKDMQNFMIQSVDIERNVLPVITKCLDGIVRAAQQISEKEKVQTLIKICKSGFQPPQDISFEDLSAMESDEAPAAITSIRPEATGNIKKKVDLCGIFRGESREDCSDLLPSGDIRAKIQQETAAGDGLTRMRDPMSIEKQPNESGHKMDEPRQESQKVEGVNNKPGVVLSVSPSAASRRNGGGSGGEEDSLSRSASDWSVSSAAVNHGSSDSPESGLRTSHGSLPDFDSDSQSQLSSDLCYRALPALGVCKALYPFEATCEGTLPMHNGEELHVVELGQRDGWTRVRRQSDMGEGFVPTSYIECSLFRSC